MNVYAKEIQDLNDAGAKYLVIGGLALGLHGYVRATFDLDIFPELSEDNLTKIVNVMTHLDYAPFVPVDSMELVNADNREKWRIEKNMAAFGFRQKKDVQNIVDIMIYTPFDFKEFYKNRRIIVNNGLQIPVASPEDLLKLKKYANRPKDQQDIKVLEEMVAFRNE